MQIERASNSVEYMPKQSIDRSKSIKELDKVGLVPSILDSCGG
jgi:hypothetical protein